MAEELSQILQLAPTLSPLVAAGDLSVREAFERIAELGFRFVQLNAAQGGLRPRELDHSARRDLLATLRRRELMVAGIDAWIPISHFGDPARVDHAVAALRGAIELASDLGRVPVSVSLPQDPAIISTLVEHASHHGVRLADHHVPPRDSSSFAGMDGLGIGIDPAAYLSQNLDPAAAIHGHASRLVSARVSDLLSSGLRAPLGDREEGRLDVTAYQVALSIAGYSAPVVADARQWPDPWGGLERTSQIWRR